MTLSGCLVVKNEAGFLPDCLSSIAECIDELVAVDNGSIDSTREIHASFGATVIECPDLPHENARNLYLEAARHPWILVIDADERLDSGSAPAIRTAVADAPDSTMGFNLPRFEYIGGGKWSQIRVLRLYRNDPRLRYNNVGVHSTLTTPARAHGEVASLYAPLHHLDILSSGRPSSKRANYRKRIRTALSDPHLPEVSRGQMHGFLGMEDGAIGDVDGAEREYLTAIDADVSSSSLYLAQLYLLQDRLTEAVEQAGQISPEKDMVHAQAAMVLAEVALRKGRPEEALELCMKTLRRHPAMPNLHINIAALLGEHDPTRAIYHLNAAIALNSYLLKPVIYRKGDEPNIFAQQSSFLSNTRTVFDHMARAHRSLGDESTAGAWCGAWREVVDVVDRDDGARMFLDVACPFNA